MCKWKIALRATALALVAIAVTGRPAQAHHMMGGRTPSTFTEGLLSGLGHPVIGIDHLAFILAMGVAVGIAGLFHGYAFGESIFGAETSPLAAYLLGLVIVLLGIAGDLFESRLKRLADMKDSSALIPGHGGVLDRIDALLFAIPVFYFMVLQGRVA